MASGNRTRAISWRTQSTTLLIQTGLVRLKSFSQTAWAATTPKPTSQAPTALPVRGVNGQGQNEDICSGATKSAVPMASMTAAWAETTTLIQGGRDVEPGRVAPRHAQLTPQDRHEDDRDGDVDDHPNPGHDLGSKRKLVAEVEQLTMQRRRGQRHHGEDEHPRHGRSAARPRPLTPAQPLKGHACEVAGTEECGGEWNADGPRKILIGAEG